MIEVPDKVVHSFLSAYNSKPELGLIEVFSKIRLKTTYCLTTQPTPTLSWTVPYPPRSFSLCSKSYPTWGNPTSPLSSPAFTRTASNTSQRRSSSYPYFHWDSSFRSCRYFQRPKIAHSSWTSGLKTWERFGNNKCCFFGLQSCHSRVLNLWTPGTFH